LPALREISPPAFSAIPAIFCSILPFAVSIIIEPFDDSTSAFNSTLPPVAFVMYTRPFVFEILLSSISLASDAVFSIFTPFAEVISFNSMLPDWLF